MEQDPKQFPTPLIHTSPSMRRPLLVFFSSLFSILLLHELLILTFGALLIIDWLTVGLLFFPLLVLVRNVILHQYFISYTLCDEYIEMNVGIISREHYRATLNRITNFAIRQSVLQRVLGVCSVLVSTAGSDGYEFRLRDMSLDQGQKFVHLLTELTRNQTQATDTGPV